MRLFGGGGVLTRVIAELKAIRKFRSLAAWQLGGLKRRLSRSFTYHASTYKLINLSTKLKFGSLVAWKFGGITRQVLWDIICADFIKSLQPFNH